MATTVLSRLWFMSKGCKQVPFENTGNRVRWAHPDGYFLNEKGQIVKHTFAPSQVHNTLGSSYPGMRECLPRPCHVIMSIAFYGERPTFIDEKTGKPYKGISHHLISNKLDYRPVNLLCWLTRSEHRIADNRQRALRTVVPDGNLYLIDIDFLRRIQDPRVTSDAEFNQALESIRAKGYHRVDPLAAAAEERRKYV